MAMQPPPVPDPKKSARPVAAPAAKVPQVKLPQPGQAQPAPAQPAVAAAAEEQVLELSFWQHPFVQNVLPFLTSIVLHLGLIVIGMVTVEAVRQVVHAEVEQVVIPEADMMEMEGDPAGIINPGLGGDPTRPARQNIDDMVPPDSPGIAEKKGTDLIPQFDGGGSGSSEGSALISLGMGGLGGAGSGFGSGRGSGTGSGTGGDGSGVLAPFGQPGGGGRIGPKAGFINSKGKARKIAYICDASGSMLHMFDLLRIEIRKSVENLKPIQSFNVLFFQEDGYQSVDKTSLMAATADTKRKTYDFLDKVVPHGRTNPIPALESAFAQNPELIFLLTDGDFSGPGNEAVVEFCKKKTADGRVKINTIAFVSPEYKNDPTGLAFVRALKDIATNSGGQFRHVTEEDMGGK